jgi:hypothetical protein
MFVVSRKYLFDDQLLEEEMREARVSISALVEMSQGLPDVPEPPENVWDNIDI